MRVLACLFSFAHPCPFYPAPPWESVATAGEGRKPRKYPHPALRATFSRREKDTPDGFFLLWTHVVTKT
jgi:hypothetical protein